MSTLHSRDESDLVDASHAADLRSWLRFRELVRNLVLKDLRLKYRGSVFGFLWSLVNPLVMVAVYTLAFGYILQIRTPAFVLFLVSGLLAWGYFAAAAVMSTGAVIDSGSLVKSVYFPRAILPLSTVLFNLAQYVMTIVVIVPLVLLLHQVPPTLPMVCFPVFLVLQTGFTIGVAFTLATLTAFLRDVRHFLEIALQVLFWLTPIVYEFRAMPDRLKPLVLASPLSPYILGYQQSLYYGEWPPAWMVGLATLYAIAALGLGLFLFRRYEDRFTEQL
jgi:ABC-2 type transport system permease protein